MIAYFKIKTFNTLIFHVCDERLDVTVYIFYEVLNLLSHLYIFIYTEEKNKTLQFVNFILLWQISTEDLRKKMFA